jgi:hypothetical protein
MGARGGWGLVFRLGVMGSDSDSLSLSRALHVFFARLSPTGRATLRPIRLDIFAVGMGFTLSYYLLLRLLDWAGLVSVKFSWVGVDVEPPKNRRPKIKNNLRRAPTIARHRRSHPAATPVLTTRNSIIASPVGACIQLG